MLWGRIRKEITIKLNCIKVLHEKEANKMANQLGKRFECKVCGGEILCTKPGEGAVHCCEQEMQIKQPVSLPTAD